MLLQRVASVGLPGPGARAGLPLLAWLAGVFWQLQQAALWPAKAVAVAAVLALLLLGFLTWLGWRRPLVRPRWPALLAALLAAALLGAAVTHLRAALRLADALPPALEGVDLQVTGVISDLPRASLQGTRFVLDVETAWHDGRAVQIPQRLALGWYRGVDVDALLAGASEDLRAGDRWHLTLRLKQPHGTMNPHGFDLELWLFERGIRGSGNVRAVPGAVNQRLGLAVGQPVQRARQAVRDAIFERVADPAAAGVLAALAIGDQAAIERADWDLFRITGVAHLMAISGLHITMFAWGAAALISLLWRQSPRAMLAVPAPVAARWGGLALAAAYALLAGWGVPAQRTVWMLAVVALLRSLGLRWPWPGVLLLAAVVVSLADPWALLQPGFWLSFVAVGLLVASEPMAARSAARPEPVGAAARLRAAAAAGVRTQAIATVGLAPLSMLFFQQLSVVGFAANLLAIPLVTLLVTPLALLGMLLPPVWALAAALVQGLSWVLQQLAAWPVAVWSAAAAPPWAAVCGLLGGLLAVLPLPWRLRCCALPLMLPLLWPAVPRPDIGRFELLAADIGQGTAVLVRTKRHLLVYDTGPAYTPEADAGSRVLLPLLRASGERQIDVLMLSHRDTDHVGGAASLLAGLPVAAISSSLEPGHPLLRGRVPQQRCAAGQAWVWDGVRFEVLHPAVELDIPATPSARRPNAQSCVLRVQGRDLSALLTGDIEADQEAGLVQRHGAALASDVLLVPHHGSRTSSTPAFLEAVAPRVAVVQAGYRSRFGHPAPAVLVRYQVRGIAVMRSDVCGAYSLLGDGRGRCERLARARYWHHPEGLAARAVATPVATPAANPAATP
jgi:competence protein ComEC